MLYKAIITQSRVVFSPMLICGYITARNDCQFCNYIAISPDRIERVGNINGVTDKNTDYTPVKMLYNYQELIYKSKFHRNIL